MRGPPDGPDAQQRDAAVEARMFCDGRLALSVSLHEMRMSHWVHAPKVVRTATAMVLFDLRGGAWDLLGVREAPAHLELTLRRYPGTAAPRRVRIDAASGALDVDGAAVSGAALASVLDAPDRRP